MRNGEVIATFQCATDSGIRRDETFGGVILQSLLFLSFLPPWRGGDVTADVSSQLTANQLMLVQSDVIGPVDANVRCFRVIGEVPGPDSIRPESAILQLRPDCLLFQVKRTGNQSESAIFVNSLCFNALANH